jgi:hypothetical protein
MDFEFCILVYFSILLHYKMLIRYVVFCTSEFKMKRFALIVFLVLFWGSSALLTPASYKGKSIDKKHFWAEIQMKGTTNKYRVDVVFVGKAANMNFGNAQMLPMEAGNNPLLSLFLMEPDIKDPEKIVLKQVSPPVVMDDRKPEDWPATAIWFMKLELKEPNKNKNQKKKKNIT